MLDVEARQIIRRLVAYGHNLMWVRKARLPFLAKPAWSRAVPAKMPQKRFAVEMQAPARFSRELEVEACAMQLEKAIVQSRAVFDDADVETVIEASWPNRHTCTTRTIPRVHR